MSLECQACGSPIEIKSILTRAVVCPYCGSISELRNNQLSSTGAKAPQIDTESQLKVGQRISAGEEQGLIIGYIRFTYPGGFWDEWAIMSEVGEVLYLQDDEGAYTLFRSEKLNNFKLDFESIKTGTTIDVNNSSVFINEKYSSTISLVSGEIKASIMPGTAVNGVDGIGNSLRYAIEFYSDETCVYIGTKVEREAVDVI